MSKRNLLFSAALPFMSLALAPAALAQQAPPTNDQVVTTPVADVVEEDEAKEEEIVVTGSRIRRESFDAPFPTLTIGKEQIEQRQFTNIVDALNELPFVGPGSTRNGANTQFGDNFSFPDILNCGTERTLTLINGRRLTPANQASLFVPGNAPGAQVDLSVLNPGFIERTDAVTGTGGVIYGADAVCGVVNVITKSDFEGAQFTAQGGITEFGDGGNGRLVGTFGKNFFNGKLNVLVGVEYFHGDQIRNGGRPFQRAQAFRNNPLQAAVRNSANFNVQQEIANLIAGGTLTSAFLPSTADNQPVDFFSGAPTRNPVFAQGGVLVTSQQTSGGALAGGVATPIFPNAPLPAGFAAAGNTGTTGAIPFSFFAPTTLPAGVTAAQVIASLAPGVSIAGLTAAQQTALAVNLLQRNRPTPQEYAQANPNINPLLFVARFQPTGLFPTIVNPDAATRSIFPRVAVPLRFDSQGNLAPFNLGSFDPLTSPTVTSLEGGDGFAGQEFRTGNLQSGTDRGNINLNTTFNITNNIRYKTENLWSEQRFRSNIGPQGLQAAGSNANFNNGAVPLFVNQNPFISDQARATISQLQSQGLTLPTVGGQPVLFVSTLTQDLIIDKNSTNDTRTIRTAHILEGDFRLLNRNFYWDTAFSYGRVRTINNNPQRLDIENALATDTVRDANGNIVCRQQTLSAPESVALRNPFLGQGNNPNATSPAFNTNVPNALIPTAAQIAACVPVNPGITNPSQAAIDYIISDITVRNTTQQYYAAGSLGGDLVELPAGPLSFSTQFEWRRESNTFAPDSRALAGVGNNLVSVQTTGALRFFEGNFEFLLPIFGEDFRLPLFEKLQFEGTVRVVSRNQFSGNPSFAAFDGTGGPTDITFNAGGRWAPIESLTFRGFRSRTVRSPSIVDLYLGLQIATTNAANVCTPATIGQGPAPATRRANCIQAAIATGAAANSAAAETFLGTFSALGGQTSGSGGTPSLNNEVADTFTGGVTYRPKWAKSLVLSGDYIALDLSQVIVGANSGTTSPQCFDNSNFAAGNFDPLCEFLVIGTQNSAGQFVVPTVNPVTGGQLPPGAIPGTLATNQQPFQLAYVFSPRINLARQEIRAISTSAQYSFDLADVLGKFGSNLGSITLVGSTYWLRRFDIFTTGTAQSLNQDAGDNNPTLTTRLTINHRIGKLNHQLLWIRQNETVGNVQTPLSDFDEQSISFVLPSINTFNYSATYNISDVWSFGFVANDVTRATPYFNVVNNPVGRTFSLSISARF